MLRDLRQRKKIALNRSYRRAGHFTLASETKQGIAIVMLFTMAFLMLLSFFQATGSIGLLITSTLSKLFGWGDWLFPVLLLILTYMLLQPARYDVKLINYGGLVLAIISYSGLLHLIVRAQPLQDIIQHGAGGGYLGYAVGNSLYQRTEFWGAFLILIALASIGFLIFFNTSFISLFSFFRQLIASIGTWLSQKKVARVQRKPEPTPDYTGNFRSSDLQDEDEETLSDDSDDAADDEETFVKKEKQLTLPQAPARRKPLPKIDLPLDLLTGSTDMPAAGDVKANLRTIEATLKSFGIEVVMDEVNVGPTVTQYTLKPLEGVKLNQITALQNDLALALAAHPIRIEAPIPGKSLVGIEVPNQTVSVVKLKEVLESPAYANRKTSLMLALGKDVTGRVMMADLGKMPHLLIAGATGSGKSVCINSMIVSLLYQNSPDILKFILVDPKRVELAAYDSIPHLLAPVIIDTEKTINALRWAVHTMDERYKLLAAAGKKNIQGYNDARLVDKMPYIVIVIDELADLMMVAAKEVENAVIRIAQMARAVGIHLILATQRPSVNVITGLIKANITSRIAFSVASSTDSRTIIDSSGAEKLLGNGDMLYISAELSKPRRLQGALIGEKEITAVTEYLKEHGEPQYDIAVTERKTSYVSGSSGAASVDAEERDVLMAADVVIKAKRASATLLQSRMRVGFAKASRLLDILEERGIIGPQNSSKPREVLITREEFNEQFGSYASNLEEEASAEPDQTDEIEVSVPETDDERDDSPDEENLNS